MMTAAASLAWRIATSRIGIAAIAATLSYGAGYHRGYSRADRQAEITALESRVIAKEADLTAARNAERIARDQADILAERAIQNQEIVNDLAAELAARPERAVCSINKFDAHRLRSIDAGEGGASPRPAPTPLMGDPGEAAAAKDR